MLGQTRTAQLGSKVELFLTRHILGLHALVASFATPAIGHEHLITFGVLGPAAHLEPVLISDGLGGWRRLIAARKAR